MQVSLRDKDIFEDIRKGDNLSPSPPAALPQFPGLITKIKNGQISIDSHCILGDSLAKNISKNGIQIQRTHIV